MHYKTCVFTQRKPLTRQPNLDLCPSPEHVDELLESADVVLGLGGGAMLDFAKAIAAMVPLKSENLAQTGRFLLGAFVARPFPYVSLL